jgi:hypothetical protein
VSEDEPLFITQQMIQQLIELNDRFRVDAGRAADAGSYMAGCVMMSSAIETMLFCSLGMSQHVLELAGLWPEREDPFKWTLGRMIGLATAAGWFAGRDLHGVDLSEAVDALNDLRIMWVHPAAYIRDGGQSPREEHFAALFAILLAVDEALGDVVKGIPAPPRARTVPPSVPPSDEKSLD